MMGEGDRYASCKTDLERRGYLRRPEGQESEETKQVIRDIDAARAASIKKGEAAAQLDVPHSPEGEGSPSTSQAVRVGGLPRTAQSDRAVSPRDQRIPRADPGMR